MTGLGSFLQMGGYAGFVWPAYGITALALIILAVASFRTARRRSDELKRLQAASPHRRRRAHGVQDKAENGI